MATFLKNKLPDILKARKLSISDLQNLMAQDEDTRTSYPAVRKIASEKELRISDTLSVGTLRKVATALGVTLNDLVEITRETNR
jgi:hypothetical protein